jgi:glutathione S-transferase
MILIGQYDSPFVRRVAIALTIYQIAFEHRPWSVFGDADKLAAFNPLRRVPTLVLDDGEVLIESGAILDALDETVGETRALMPARGPARRRALKVCALAGGLADKAVSLVYERLLHEVVSPVWIERCRGQMAGVLDALEADRAARLGLWWLGEAITHADIMAACALRFAGEAHPEVVDLSGWPRLAAHSAACEALPAFQRIQQPFVVTPPAT